MTHLLRSFVLAALFLSSATAGACELEHEGVYTNPAYDGEFNRAQVTVTKAPKNSMRFEIMIPCGSKVTPAQVTFACRESGGHYLNFDMVSISTGGGQCALGAKPQISILGDEMTIYTGIRTPGLDGRYVFRR